MLVIKQLTTVAIDHGNQWLSSAVGLPACFKISFVFNRRKKRIQFWNNM